MMERKIFLKKICAISILLLLCLTFISTTRLVNAETLEEHREEIVAVVSIGFLPAYGTDLTKLVIINFNDINALPMNTSLTAFSNLNAATLRVIPWGNQGYAIKISTSYETTIGNNTSDERSKKICEEFLKVFGQTNLSEFDKRETYDSMTITIERYYGFFNGDLATIENLVKYKPTDGFGILITRNFLSKFVPYVVLSNYSCGLTDLVYTLQKQSSLTNSFRWGFRIGYSSSKITTSDLDDKEVDIDINGLLGHQGIIEPMSQTSAEINLEIYKNATTPTKTYFMNLDSISPPYTRKQESEAIIVTYDLNGPIDDIIAKIKITTVENPNFDWTIIATLVVIFVVGLIVCLFIIKQRKTKHSRSNEKNSRLSPAVKMHGSKRR